MWLESKNVRDERYRVLFDRIHETLDYFRSVVEHDNSPESDLEYRQFEMGVLKATRKFRAQLGVSYDRSYRG